MSISDRLSQSRRGLLAMTALGAAAAVIALIATRLPSSQADAANAAGAPVALTVTAKTLDAEEIARGIVANGSIFPWQEIIIGPEVGGYRVEQVSVDVGDRVRKGQELVRLSGALLASEVASKKASVLQAQATVANTASALKRAQSLSASGVVSASDLDRLNSEELAAQARVEVAKAELESAELRLRYTRVTAPDDGIISVRNVSVGQIAQSGAEMLRMVRKGRIEWRAEVPEARMREIRVGQLVHLVTADGTRLDGKVRTVAPTIEAATRAGLIYVDIASPAAKPGMFARGEIVLERSSAHMAPIASVVIQDGYSYVFVLNADNTVQRRHIETGIVKGNSIEIVDGLRPGERIVDKGAGFLKDGDRVKVVTGEAAEVATAEVAPGQPS